MSTDLERSWLRLALGVEMLEARLDSETQLWLEYVTTVRALAEVLRTLAAIRGRRRPSEPNAS